MPKHEFTPADRMKGILARQATKKERYMIRVDPEAKRRLLKMKTSRIQKHLAEWSKHGTAQEITDGGANV